MNDVTEVIDEINKGFEDSTYKKVQDAVSETVSIVKLAIGSPYLQLCESISSIMAPLSQRLKEMQDVFNNSRLSSIISKISSIYKNSPFWDWLNSFDFSDILDNIKEKEVIAYMQIMYDSKWFPLVGAKLFDDSVIDYSLIDEACHIALSSRGASKRREKRIDKIVLDFYDANAIKSIKRGWDKSDLAPYLKKILKQAINAHLRGEYFLTISGLTTLWESLIQLKKDGVILKTTNTATKEAFKDLTEKNGYNEKIGKFYENYIVSKCNNEQEKVDGIPNRNGVAHGKYFKYPTQKESLNAILITDFIINLQAIKQENDNGQT